MHIEPFRIDSPKGCRWLILAFCLGLVVLDRPVQAYPPAPFHLFFGMLRDEYGTPINIRSAEVIFETASGVKVKTTVNPGIETAANYWLEVPMHSGLVTPSYQPTALRPLAPFRIQVRIGTTTYLPIEMIGDFATLGRAGERTRLNLTLGEDTDGDGLPDAWERLINEDISKVSPGSAAGNGLNYLDTYYAGTYAVDPKHGFDLTITGFHEGAPRLEFLAVTGRTYTLLASHDLKSWEKVWFRLPAEGTNAAIRGTFMADTVRPIQMEAVHQGTGPAPTFFRLMLW
jgi:hypothetical protein